MYALALLTMGLHPLTADTAEDGFASACEFCPAVIVADVTLPAGSGLDLMRQLRQDGRTKNTRIIVLTADAGAEVKRRANDAGCDRFMVKPCLPDRLAVEIWDVLGCRRDTTLSGRPIVEDQCG